MQGMGEWNILSLGTGNPKNIQNYGIVSMFPPVPGIVHLLENSGDPPDFDNGQAGADCQT